MSLGRNDHSSGDVLHRRGGLLEGDSCGITPVRSVDRIPVGDARPGPIMNETPDQFFDVDRDRNDKYHCLTFLGD